MDVLVVGEAFVDFLPPRSGSLTQVGGFEMYAGGAPCNVARGAARLGVHAGFVSTVAGDEFGNFIVERLEEDEIELSWLRRCPEMRTQLCFITLDSAGERSFTGRGPDASLALSVKDVEASYVAAARVLSLSCGALRTKQGLYAVERALQAATGWICCDPGTCPPDWLDPSLMRRRLFRVFARCHVLKCSQEEAEWLVEETELLTAARALLQLGPQYVVITLGAGGALWCTAASWGEVESPQVDAVDTTGAGDGFMAALISCLAAEPHTGELIDEARWVSYLRFSAVVGAEVVQRRGAVEGIQRRTQQEREIAIDRLD